MYQGRCDVIYEMLKSTKEQMHTLSILERHSQRAFSNAERPRLH